MATSRQREMDNENENQESVAELNPRKKPRKVKRQMLNGAIRHFLMVGWFINVVNIDELEEAYYTPGSSTGFELFVQLLLERAKQKMLELATHFANTGANVENAHKDEEALQEMCKQSALNWRREWNLWKDSMEKKDWMASDEGAFVWRRFTSTDTLWEANREKLAEEVEKWFNVVSGSISRVFIVKDKRYMLDEPITEPSLTCVRSNDIYSSWDDESRIRHDFQHDYHLIRFSVRHFTKFYGAPIMYVAKRFKRFDLEGQIMAQQRLYIEIQISGIRMCGLVNPVAMINDEECPTLIFLYWNGETLEDMLRNMKIHQDQVLLGNLDSPNHRLGLFMMNRLEIALALLETLICMHGNGWIHNKLHAKNILLHFPAWQWTKDGEPKITGSTDLVFVGISNFGKACKAKQANSEWAPKFDEWDWETKPHGPAHHIAPELWRTSDTNKSHWEGMRFYTEMTDMYALGTSIKALCTGFFAGWHNASYCDWHDRLNHDREFRERMGVENRLVRLLHRLSHPDSDLRKTAKINTRQWREDLEMEISGKMFGLQSMVDSLDKTQRSLDDFIPPPMEVDSEGIEVSLEDETPFSPSPSKRPSTEKCNICSEISGKPNVIQLAWMNTLCEKFGSKYTSHIRIPMEIWPDIPSWSKPPVLSKYLLKPLFIWHPENQFGISIAQGKCPHCSKIGCLKFKQYTQPRHVQCLTTDAYMVSARYVCSQKLGGCAKTFAIFDEDVVRKSNIVPGSILLKCPVHVFHKNAWKTDLVQSMFDLVSGRAKINDFIAMLRNSRTSEYMKTACTYRDHIQYYLQLQLSRDRFTSTQSEVEKYPDFPQYFAHCEGYNGTLGPSTTLTATIFQDIVTQQRPFFDRYEGGLVGTHLSADHHHNVPGRIHFTDKFSKKKFAGIHGLHTVMNERHQIISHRWIAMTNNEERVGVADDLLKRYHDCNIDTNDIIMYLDKCCDDYSWLSSFPGVRVLLDNHHLITRYRDNSNGTNRAKHDQFMKKIALIISGSDMMKMRPGPVIFDELTKFLVEFEELESKQERPFAQIITTKTRDCHKTQEKHFRRCITKPENPLVTIPDRFCRKILRRGSGKNENAWRHMRAAFPENCSFNFGDAFMAMMVASWNFNREMQYDPRWAYLPISPMHIILTQHLARLPREQLTSSDGISSMFQCLPLAVDDCKNKFGLSESFANAILPALPTIPQQSHDAVSQMASSIVDFAIWDSFTFDTLVHQAVDIASSIDMSAIPSIHLAESSRANEEARQPSLDGGDETSHMPHPIVTHRKRKQSAVVSHVRSTLTSHKKKAGSTNAIGNHRQPSMESLHIWNSIMSLSPMLNPFERHVLRFLALRCLLPQPIDTLSEFPIKTFHFPVLERLWSVIVSAIRISNFEFKEYLRPKSSQSLKQQLEDMVEMTNFNLNFGPTAQSRTMVSTLQESAKKLVSMVHTPVAAARRTVTTTFTRIEVVKVVIPLQHASDPMATKFDDMMAVPSIAQEIDQLEPTLEPSPNEFLLSLVENEQKDHVGTIRWKQSIAPQWNTWSRTCGKDPMTHMQLKNRYHYLQRLQRISTPIVSMVPSPPSIPQPMVPPSTTPISSTVEDLIMEPQPPFFVDDHPITNSKVQETLPLDSINDRLKDVASFDIPSSSNAFIPPKNMPSWELIKSTIVPQAPRRSPYSAQESALFTYLLNTHAEQAKHSGARSTIDWTKFSKRWEYWCQVEIALGSHDFMLRTKEQLKQKKKDNASSSKS